MRKKILLILFILVLVYTIEPLVRERISWAIPQEISTEPITLTNSQLIGHAPEPSTFILFLGGIAGLVVNFIRKSYDKFKRFADIFLACIGLILTAPILAFATMLIKLTSKGPIVYKQNRVGKGSTIFEIYKLRTMCVDAEKQTGAVWAKKNDPRITPVGKLLRKTHIDEIPQLLNVINGEMSIVGPRPERPEMVRDFKTLILDYEKRLQVKPGITGLAQVWHKYDETIDDVKKKIKYDLLYIKKICLWVDLRVIAQTFAVVLTGKGAR
jgi:exopolysaccharide biosynthesis polyprenyl glycosylphosphotransferase